MNRLVFPGLLAAAVSMNIYTYIYSRRLASLERPVDALLALDAMMVDTIAAKAAENENSRALTDGIFFSFFMGEIVAEQSHWLSSDRFVDGKEVKQISCDSCCFCAKSAVILSGMPVT